MFATDNRRCDLHTANNVRSGLVVLDMYGPAVAARWMRMRGIPLGVAEKVILKPWQRRHGDNVIAWQPARS